MKLPTFEKYIDEKILQRGRDYFRRGYDTFLEQEDDDQFAEISRSDDYEVTVVSSNFFPR